MSVHRYPNGEAFTPYGWSVCLWVLVIAFQYGYHISALNQIQAVITCKDPSIPADFFSKLELPTCLPMSDFTFSVVTSIFTIGGLLGSSVANLVMDRWGRKGAMKLGASMIVAGAGLMSISASVHTLGFGRFLIGIGSGIGICVGPIYLAEIAPSTISGNVGVLTQLAIVFGIMTTQSIGLRLATPTEWRVVFFVSCALCLAQLVTSPFVTESPAWLAARKRLDQHQIAQKKLWGSTVAPSTRDDLEDPLLDSSAGAHREESIVNIPTLLASRELRRPLMIMCLAMMSQQLSGINAVLYYSNDILAKSLPEFGPYISLGITIINVLMTFPPIILIERLGRKRLLAISIIGAIASLAMVGFGLNNGFVTLSSFAIITFVMSYAVGLGPIPFVMIPEVSPAHAVSALSSVSLSLNWIVNFLVGLVFLPLRNLLAGDDKFKEGRVFYVFVAILSASSLMLSRVYRGRA